MSGAAQASSQGASSLPALDPNLSKDDRISKRRDRVETAISAKREAAGEADRRNKREAEDALKLTRGETQVLESEERLNETVESGLSAITLIRLQGDHGENERRLNEEMKNESRQQKLMEEASNAAKRNAAISMKWSTLYDVAVPQDLQQELDTQKEACDRVVASKDRLIAEFRTELRAKDQEYVNALRKQADDIDTMIHKMHSHTREMMESFEQELKEIEQAFLQERKELLDANREKLDQMYEQRRQLEKVLLEKRLRRAEEQSEELDKMRESDAQNYSRLKIDLQKDIQELEQEAEEIRARYLLNSEKLDYNFQVLSERVVENKLTITQHKRKLARLQDNLSVVMVKCQKAEKQYKAENNELTEQYNRVTKQFKDLQLKFKQFEKQDLERFREVWQMNEEIAFGLIEKLMSADRVISEQQLGVDWNPPADDLFVSEFSKMSHDGADASRPEAMSASSGTGSSKLASRAGRTGTGINTPGRPLSDNVRKMLEMLCDEAGFLVEDRVTQLTQSLPEDERKMIRVDSILKSLGVESQQEVESMLPYFVKAAYGEDPNRAQIISREDVVRAVRAFVEDQQRQAARMASTVTVSLEEKAEKKRRDRERSFWERLSTAIPENRLRLWNALESGLEQYNQVLTVRSNLLDDTETLRMQNQELRSLLNQYLHAKINEELYVPPVLGGQQLYRN
eukprot:ANDGO_06495.mRNA.1 Dynein regulatory complex protein 1